MQNSKYTFAVRVKGKNVPEYENNGDNYIEGRKGSEYELYFKNKTYNRVLVIPSVDGLSTIDGKTASDKSNGYVVNGYQEVVIPGWKINSAKAAKFQFRPQNDNSNTTYVELLQEEGFDVDSSNQGVIGCMVFEEVYNSPKVVYQPYPIHDTAYPLWPNIYPYKNYYINPYSDFYNYNGGGGSASIETLDINNSYSPLRSSGGYGNSIQESDLGTGFGDDTKFETSSTEFERKSFPDWIAVINYDTLQGLRKKGIFINHNPNNKAFPGYNDSGCYIPKKR